MGIAESNRITTGLRYLAEQTSASRDEFRRDNAPGGAALCESLLSHGYAIRGRTAETLDRIALSDAGRRRLQAAAVDADAGG